jgi:hypothetical protein
MEALKFPANDPLYLAVSSAFTELSNVTVVASSTATRIEADRSRNIKERILWAGDNRS